MNHDDKIFVAGHSGLVGSAICRKLTSLGFKNILTRTRQELELTNQAAVNEMFARERPDFVFMAAAKVGGIYANSTYPADFIRDNILVQCNLIDSAWRCGAKKLCFLGSSCIYPKMAPQPIKEEYLLTGDLEPTNQWYAIAKIAGIKQCQAYRRQYGFNTIAVMPTNLYGPKDNFDTQNSHVIPGLMKRFHEAKKLGYDQVTVWGSGNPRREFMHVDDLADAVIYLMQTYDREEIINVGVGEDVSIHELAKIIAEVVGFTGVIKQDPSMPDGTPRKLLDVTRVSSFGWQAKISLKEGLRSTYAWFLEREANKEG